MRYVTKKAGVAIATLLLFLFALVFDKAIVLFATAYRTTALNIIFTYFTYMGSTIVILFLVTSLFMWQEHKRKFLVPFWLALVSSAFVSYLLKIIVARPRPNILLNIIPLVGSSGFSFPSGHAAVTFSALPVMNKEYPQLKYVWTTAAVLVALSRVYLGVHYLSDVIFGAVLGYCCGWFFLEAKKREWFKKIIDNIQRKSR